MNLGETQAVLMDSNARHNAGRCAAPSEPVIIALMEDHLYPVVEFSATSARHPSANDKASPQSSSLCLAIGRNCGNFAESR